MSLTSRPSEAQGPSPGQVDSRFHQTRSIQFTTAATATFIFLVGDWAHNNRSLTSEEHRRLRGVLVSLVIGATPGSLLLMHAPLYAPVLPLVITALVVAIAARVFRNDVKPRPGH
jgi:hypothetical protein